MKNHPIEFIKSPGLDNDDSLQDHMYVSVDIRLKAMSTRDLRVLVRIGHNKDFPCDDKFHGSST